MVKITRLHPAGHREDHRKTEKLKTSRWKKRDYIQSNKNHIKIGFLSSIRYNKKIKQYYQILMKIVLNVKYTRQNYNLHVRTK